MELRWSPQETQSIVRKCHMEEKKILEGVVSGRLTATVSAA